MTHLIIESEGDIECGLNLATELASKGSKEMFLELSFPNKFLSKVFVNNLVMHWMENDVPTDNGLNINIYIPGEGDDYGNDYQV